jgi:hypothetical protein
VAAFGKASGSRVVAAEGAALHAAAALEAKLIGETLYDPHCEADVVWSTNLLAAVAHREKQEAPALGGFTIPGNYQGSMADKQLTLRVIEITSL